LRDASSLIAATPALSAVLAVGNTTGTSDIIIGTGRNIRSANGGGQILLDAGGTADLVTISTDNGALLESYISMNATSSIVKSPSMQLIGTTSLLLDSPIVRMVQVPTTDNTNTLLLSRDTVTGNIEQVSVASIVAQGLKKFRQQIALTAGNNVITHNIGNDAVQVVVYDAPGGQLIIPDQVYNATTNTITIRLSQALPTAYVVVIG